MLKPVISVPTVDEIEKADKQMVAQSTFRRNKPLTIQQSPEKPTSSKSTSSTIDTPATSSDSDFSNAFSNLKRSKYFEEPDTDPNEKLIERPKTVFQPSKNSIIVNTKQRGNPVLKYIRNVPWEFSDTLVPDYELGQSTCALFLSLRYHNLNRDYLDKRLKELGKSYQLQILLVLVDIREPQTLIQDLNHFCFFANLTLMMSWSTDEAGRCLENYKAYENKPPDLLLGKLETAPYDRLVEALSSIKSVTKVNAVTLLSSFGTFEKVTQATAQEIAVCPGIGLSKAQKISDVLHKPFLKLKK